LIKYQDYTREAVHDILDPYSVFTPQAGTWGLQGIVRIPDRRGDFVFFVTRGKRQGDHVFNEHITVSGILVWQSQPSQKLTTPMIREFIEHDHSVNDIYVFFRTVSSAPYTYMGKLAYVAHDETREQPVHFRWQILDWDIPQGKLKSMGLELAPDPDGQQASLRRDPLHRVEPAVSEAQVRQRNFASKRVDCAQDEARAHMIVLGGELLVLTMEKHQLARVGRPDLAKRVAHTSSSEGHGVGYHIQSYFPDGTVKYIGVKTTVGGPEEPFILAASEVTFSRANADQYVLVRVYEYDKSTFSGKYFVLEGDIAQRLMLKPTEFRAMVKEA
jgi:hypothetical protein